MVSIDKIVLRTTLGESTMELTRYSALLLPIIWTLLWCFLPNATDESYEDQTVVNSQD